jgi:hypothetical protein
MQVKANSKIVRFQAGNLFDGLKTLKTATLCRLNR